jgi:hypothetical protein
MTIRNVNERKIARDVHDPEIEDREVRKTEITHCEAGLRPGTKVGMLSFIIEPGEELGELYFNTQYEAMPGEHDACQDGQNKLLLDGGAWLRELLDRIASDDAVWDIEIHPVPCPSTNVPVPVERVVETLRGTQAVVEEKRAIDTGHSTETSVNTQQ